MLNFVVTFVNLYVHGIILQLPYVHYLLQYHMMIMTTKKILVDARGSEVLYVTDSNKQDSNKKKKTPNPNDYSFNKMDYEEALDFSSSKLGIVLQYYVALERIITMAARDRTRHHAVTGGWLCR